MLGFRVWFQTKGKTIARGKARAGNGGAREKGEKWNSGDTTEDQGPDWQEVDCRTEYNCCVLAKGEGAGPPYL